MGLKRHVWIDVPVGRSESHLGKLSGFEGKADLSIDICVPECVFCCFHFTEAGLVRLEEQSVHVGELHFIIVKEKQL